MTTMTYLGKLHDGKIELEYPLDLPEGSEVYVVVQPPLDVHAATGAIVTDLRTAKKMVQRGAELARSAQTAA